MNRPPACHRVPDEREVLMQSIYLEIQQHTHPTNFVSGDEKSIGLSPGRVTELRSKKLQEIRDLQCLLDQSRGIKKS